MSTSIPLSTAAASAAPARVLSTPREDPLRLIPRVRTKLHTWWLEATYPFAATGSDLSIHHTVDLRRSVAHRIRLGSSVYISEHAWINISAREETGEALILENGCRIGRGSQISARNLIHMEADVLISPMVLVMDHNHAYEDVTQSIDAQGLTEGGRIVIGKGAFIGRGAAVLCSKGDLVIGEHCVIAANSVVTRSFPPFSVISGNPAKVLRQYDPKRGVWVLGSVGLTNSQGAGGGSEESR